MPAGRRLDTSCSGPSSAAQCSLNCSRRTMPPPKTACAGNSLISWQSRLSPFSAASIAIQAPCRSIMSAIGNASNGLRLISPNSPPLPWRAMPIMGSASPIASTAEKRRLRECCSSSRSAQYKAIHPLAPRRKKRDILLYERGSLVENRGGWPHSLYSLSSVLPDRERAGRFLLYPEEYRRQTLFFGIRQTDRFRH